MSSSASVQDFTSLLLPNTIDYEREIKAPQGSDAWHEVRNKTIGSSEAAAVFPSNISKTVQTAELRAKLRGEKRRAVSDYLQAMFDEGSRQEPVLRRELEQLTGFRIVETGIFMKKLPGNDVALTASLDGIALGGEPTNLRVLLTEFKWRCSHGDCGWGLDRNELGLTVWCQVQHQMRVVNCKRALVYSGSRSGKRRLWLVNWHDTYPFMWDAWFVFVTADLNAPVRARNGTRVSVEKQLKQFRKESSREIPVPDRDPAC